MINFDRIHGNLFVGTCPSSEIDVRRLTQAGISAVVNLQSDQDFSVRSIDWPDLEQRYYQSGIMPYRIPMIDFDEADIERLLPQATRVLATALEAGHRVYLHCTAGRERSPTTAVAWLAWYGGMSLEQALKTVRDARKTNPYEGILKRLSIDPGPPSD
jgi:protein-tyrosine phosphatase